MTINLQIFILKTLLVWGIYIINHIFYLLATTFESIKLNTSIAEMH